MKLFLIGCLWISVLACVAFPVLMWIRNTPRPAKPRPLAVPNPRMPFICCEHDPDCETKGVPCRYWRGPMVIDARAVFARWNAPRAHGGALKDWEAQAFPPGHVEAMKSFMDQFGGHDRTGGANHTPYILPGKHRIGMGRACVTYSNDEAGIKGGSGGGVPDSAAITDAARSVYKAPAGLTSRQRRGIRKRAEKGIDTPSGLRTSFNRRCVGYPDCGPFPCAECEVIK